MTMTAEQRRNNELPESLHAAYNWTKAANELDALRVLTDEDLAEYIAESVANCASEGDGDVDAADLGMLHYWLVKTST